MLGHTHDEQLAGHDFRHELAVRIENVDDASQADDLRRAAVGDNACGAFDGRGACGGDDLAAAGTLGHVEQEQPFLQLKLTLVGIESEGRV
ncbi:MAG: hypothetical protein WCV00_16765 [Verrucomicrobiia bacterium]